MKKIKIGNEITLDSVEIIEAYDRSWLLKIVVFMGLGSIIITAIYGAVFKNGNFEELNTVWVTIGPILGAIVGYYFQKSTNKTE